MNEVLCIFITWIAIKNCTSVQHSAAHLNFFRIFRLKNEPFPDVNNSLLVRLMVCAAAVGGLQACRSRGAGGATPWARATKNVKKPQNQMCESCRKA